MKIVSNLTKENERVGLLGKFLPLRVFLQKVVDLVIVAWGVVASGRRWWITWQTLFLLRQANSGQVLNFLITKGGEDNQSVNWSLVPRSQPSFPVDPELYKKMGDTWVLKCILMGVVGSMLLQIF